MIQLAWLIPATMLLAALANGLGVRRLGKLAGHIAWASMAVCCALSFAILLEIMSAVKADPHWAPVTISLWSWFDIHNPFGANRTFSVDFAFRVDQLTAVFLCFVSFIGTLVFIYATGYMKEKHGGHLELDPGYARFFSYVSLFAAMMFILVLGANLAVMFIGWEGVGLCSYLLIGYFFDKPFSEHLSCADAGRKAFVVNRIGDAGLIVGIGLIFWGLGTMDFEQISRVLTTGLLADGSPVPAGFSVGGGLITLATLAMFLGATGKSAQIPLFVWLPDAMAGPTPVSALIHAATMVTAGVYMVARLNVPYFMAPDTMAVIAIIGALTAFVAAYAGLTQRGIKKALAYSTVSQLGFMFLALGAGSMAAGIFHVFTHAFFKGCLFLCAGAVIHALHHEEDMSKMGGLRKKMPKVWIAYLLATLAIAGFPLTSGFFSKDEILFSTWLNETAGEDGGLPVLTTIALVAALMTAFYMGRTLFLTFHGKSRVDPHAEEHLHDAPMNMAAPVLVLALLAMVLGFINVPGAFGGGAHFHHFLAPVVDRGAEHVALLQNPAYMVDHAEGESLYGPLVYSGVDPRVGKPFYGGAKILATISIALGLLGLGLAWAMYGKGVSPAAESLAKRFRSLHQISFRAWGWDDFYNVAFKDGTMRASEGVLAVDKGVVDGVVNGAAALCARIGDSIRRLQNGQVQTYGLVMIIGVCMFVIYFAVGLQGFLSAGPPAKATEPAAAVQQAPAPFAVPTPDEEALASAAR